MRKISTKHLLVLLAVIAVLAIAGLLSGPLTARGAGGTVCYYDGCVVFPTDHNWLATAHQYYSASMLMSAIMQGAVGHATVDYKEDENGLLTYVACSNGVVAYAVYGVQSPPPLCPDGTPAPNGDSAQCTCVANAGAACTSTANVCGMTNTGTIQCGGTCSAGVPSDDACRASSCPNGYPPVNGQCVARCSDGTLPVNGTCRNTGCPPEYELREGSCVRTGARCAPGTVLVGSECVRQCREQNYCAGLDVMRRNASCADNLVTTCPYQCFDGGCVDAPKVALTITANPTLIRAGDTSRIQWTASNVKECAVRGTNGDSWSGISGDIQSGVISIQTTYMLTCTDLANRTQTATVLVRVAPLYQEQ